MTKQQRILAFIKLGERLNKQNTELESIVEQAGLRNPWFTMENVKRSVQALGNLLTQDQLETWLNPYPFEQDTEKAVGLIFAGNLPLVGFHDLLAVLISGFKAQVKLSSDDQVLNLYLIDQLIQIEPAFADRIAVVARIEGFDAIIATGSDNSARYFDYYFANYPHIIRKNRNGVALLNGKETSEQLNALGEDIFSYFGLGCRNVAKIFVPKGYDFVHFFEGIANFSDVAMHHKYNNNYDYNKSIYLINGDKHLDNGFLLVKPDAGLSSPLAVLFYEEYDSSVELLNRIHELEPGIQCLVGGADVESSSLNIPIVPFGQSQFPSLMDYADRVNTLAFLAKQYS